MRRGKPVVFGAEAVPDAIVAEAQRISADLRLAGRDFGFDSTGDGERWDWRGRHLQLAGLRPPSLHGRFQLRNAAAVLALIEALDDRSILETRRVDLAFGRLEIPGRFQRVSAGREWLLDVAHNPDAARVLAESLGDMPAVPKIAAIVGVLADKDVAGIVMPLAPHVNRWVAAGARHARARPAHELAREIAHLTGKPCLVRDDIPAAMNWLDADADEHELLLITGSFYTVGPALEWLHEHAGGVAAA
jgi:dihydrofolate synthase/folylpolyglutamate synthase